MPVQVLALVLVGALTLAERRWPARPERSRRVLNLGVWAARTIIQFTALPLFSVGMSAGATRLGIPSLRIDRWPLWLSAPLLVISLDLCEYLYHRAQHAIPWLWRRHALHHSDPCVTATTTERHWWGDLVLKAVLFVTPLAVVLQPSALDYSIYAAISFNHYFVHANLRVDYGRWSWVLNSPAYHRLHHAREARHYGANYAALFPIFDVILGSYRRAPGFVETGLENEPRSIVQALAWPYAKIL
jgi:sterol desaturase/sphingolipid hydroxylase (fatty acid hydroxylase superfamily)